MTARRATTPMSARVAGTASILIAAVIAVGAGLAAAAGVPTLGIVFAGAGGLLVVGIALRLFGDGWFVSRPSGGRRRSVLLLLAAVGAVALTPAVYAAGLAYGGSWLEWDPMHSTNVYVERPGGFIVLVASLVICAALVLLAVATALIVVARTLARQRDRTPAL